MEKFDRLTTLIDRFKLSVTPAMLAEANLVAFANADGSPDRALYSAGCTDFSGEGGVVMVAASVKWSGSQNPLLTALPDTVMIDLSADADSAGLVRMMQSELAAQRCGSDSVLCRLGEVLIVRMMRAQIEAGTTKPGLLAGLSDARLSRAIVAMHDKPGVIWRNEDLAQVAGMSLSRFADAFVAAVGETPATYLRRWRLTLAHQDIIEGHRVDRVAQRYGFSSTEGFTRAFKKHYGTTPIALRPKTARLVKSG